MYAALTAAERGHDVTLCEKEPQLGGLLWFTDADTHKESLKRFRDALIARCRYTGVTIMVNAGHTRACRIHEARCRYLCCRIPPLYPFYQGYRRRFMPLMFTGICQHWVKGCHHRRRGHRLRVRLLFRRARRRKGSHSRNARRCARTRATLSAAL